MNFEEQVFEKLSKDPKKYVQEQSIMGSKIEQYTFEDCFDDVEEIKPPA